MAILSAKDQEKPTNSTIPNQPLKHGFQSNKDKKWLDYYFADRVVVVKRHLSCKYNALMPFFLTKLRILNGWLPCLEKRKICNLNNVRETLASLIKYSDGDYTH